MRAVVILILFSFSVSFAQRKTVLIYTKNGKGYVHQNIAASVEALTAICKSQKWAVETSEDPAVFTAENIKRFDCLVFSNTNNETFDTEEQKAVFKAYINSGGGYVGIHSSAGSERSWPWFWAMQGGKFVRHPKLQPFNISVLDSKHLATKHLPEVWAWEDEFYYLNQLNPDIHVLLAGVLTDLEDDKKSEYPGTTFGQLFPLSWCHSYDGGRQFYTALGHKAEYYADAAFRDHLLGGMKWVMKIKK